MWTQIKREYLGKARDAEHLEEINKVQWYVDPKTEPLRQQSTLLPKPSMLVTQAVTPKRVPHTCSTHHWYTATCCLRSRKKTMFEIRGLMYCSIYTFPDFTCPTCITFLTHQLNSSPPIPYKTTTSSFLTTSNSNTSSHQSTLNKKKEE